MSLQLSSGNRAAGNRQDRHRPDRSTEPVEHRRPEPAAPTAHWRESLWTAGAVVAWLLAWQLLAWRIGQEIILASPLQVLAALARLLTAATFWLVVWTSLWHIALGFLAALLLGSLLAWAASQSRPLTALLAPPLRLMRSVPVVSFIILLLIWGGSAWLSTQVVCLMTLPVAYDNVSAGLSQVPTDLLDMAKTFQVSRWRTARTIIIPCLAPDLIAACRIGVGLAWKAGVSAEVIGLPVGTIGEQLNTAKLYLATGDLFAWTLVIVGLSILLERLVCWGLDRAQAGLGRLGL